MFIPTVPATSSYRDMNSPRTVVLADWSESTKGAVNAISFSLFSCFNGANCYKLRVLPATFTYVIPQNIGNASSINLFWRTSSSSKDGRSNKNFRFLSKFYPKSSFCSLLHFNSTQLSAFSSKINSKTYGKARTKPPPKPPSLHPLS